ncbi:hypothetical protein AB0F46_34235, partial [Streptomyces sp. NPDC026665]|uniref:hypothetical protein n=1 Tax=Streptomyces sp. NPDC026665 TaxID=3154798 RepID=UPI0033E39529
PQGWDHLTRHLRGKGFTDKELVLSGLAQEGRLHPCPQPFSPPAVPVPVPVPVAVAAVPSRPRSPS